MNLVETVGHNYKTGLTVETYEHPLFKNGSRGVIHAMHEDNAVAEVAIDGKLETTMIPIRFLAIKKHEIEGKITARKTPMTKEQKLFFIYGYIHAQVQDYANEFGYTYEEAREIMMKAFNEGVLKK